MLTKEEIKKRLEEDSSWTLPDDVTDEEWDLYLAVKKEMATPQNSDDEEWQPTEGKTNKDLPDEGLNEEL